MTRVFRTRPSHPYAHAPRFPDEGPVEIGELVRADAGGAALAPARFEIEVGPGRGVFVAERCAARPDAFVLGLEIRLKWATLVDARLVRAGLAHRARILAADARDALARLGPGGSVGAVFLHFPDPWWKKRHEKRLVLGADLLDHIARLLVPGGELFIQTDVEERADQYASLVAAHSAFEPAGDRGGSALLADNPYGARSPREKRAIADGLPIHRMRWRRKGDAAGPSA